MPVLVKERARGGDVDVELPGLAGDGENNRTSDGDGEDEVREATGEPNPKTLHEALAGSI